MLSFQNNVSRKASIPSYQHTGDGTQANVSEASAANSVKNIVQLKQPWILTTEIKMQWEKGLISSEKRRAQCQLKAKTDKEGHLRRPVRACVSNCGGRQFTPSAHFHSGLYRIFISNILSRFYFPIINLKCFGYNRRPLHTTRSNTAIGSLSTEPSHLRILHYTPRRLRGRDSKNQLQSQL